MITGILLGIIAGLLANELCEFSPWCARKLVRRSALWRYTDPDRAEMRAEELTSVINDRPGNLFKLITAVSFAGGAAIAAARRATARESDAGPGSNPSVIYEEVLAAERNAALRAAFAELPSQQQQLMLMLISDPPHSYREISAKLSIPVGSIGPQRARCLDRMRRSSALAALGEGDEKIDIWEDKRGA